MDDLASPDAVDRATITAIVRRSLQSETIEVPTWQYRPIHKVFNPSTAGVFRFTGTASDHGNVVPWSVILKSGRLWRTEDQPNDLAYWKREFCAYESGLLDNLSGHLLAPRCYGAVELPDQHTWLWLEDIADTFPSRWPRSSYAAAARHLGQFNGAFLVGRDLPDYPWLSTRRNQGYVATVAGGFQRYPDVSNHPFVRRHWPGALAEKTLRLWADRDHILAALDPLPRCLSHLDAFPGNLFVRQGSDGTDETIAIDWAYVGIGAVGEEIASFIASGIPTGQVDPTELQDLDEIVFTSYLEGLREAGWDGDPRIVRFGYTATVALRYGLKPFGIGAIDDAFRRHLEQAWDRPIEESLDRLAVMQDFLLQRAEEARALIPLLFSSARLG